MHSEVVVDLLVRSHSGERNVELTATGIIATDPQDPNLPVNPVPVHTSLTPHDTSSLS